MRTSETSRKRGLLSSSYHSTLLTPLASPSAAGAPEVESLRSFIEGAGFVDVKIERKEESREVIKQWIPGSGSENFVVSANVTGRKP